MPACMAGPACHYPGTGVVRAGLWSWGHPTALVRSGCRGIVAQ